MAVFPRHRDFIINTVGALAPGTADQPPNETGFDFWTARGDVDQRMSVLTAMVPTIISANLCASGEVQPVSMRLSAVVTHVRPPTKLVYKTLGVDPQTRRVTRTERKSSCRRAEISLLELLLLNKTKFFQTNDRRQKFIRGTAK